MSGTLLRLGLVLVFILHAPVFASAAPAGGDLLDMIASEDDLCKKLNGNPVLDPYTIPATCTAGETLSCDCEKSSIWANATYKNCKETAADFSVICTCNEEGTGYDCPNVVSGISRSRR